MACYLKCFNEKTGIETKTWVSLIFYIGFNLLITTPEYTLTGVYGKCMLNAKAVCLYRVNTRKILSKTSLVFSALCNIPLEVLDLSNKIVVCYNQGLLTMIMKTKCNCYFFFFPIPERIQMGRRARKSSTTSSPCSQTWPSTWTACSTSLDLNPLRARTLKHCTLSFYFME